MGYRPWLCEIDFLGPIAAGIRDFFPQEILSGVSDQVFDGIVMRAHDKAFEEQRFEHTLWKVMASSSLEKRQKSNATKAFTKGRKEAADSFYRTFDDGSAYGPDAVLASQQPDQFV